MTVRIQVAIQESGLAAVSAGIDDIEPIEWQGSPDEVEIANGWTPNWTDQLFIGSTQRTQYEIRNLRIGPGELPDDTKPEEPQVKEPADGENRAADDSPENEQF